MYIESEPDIAIHEIENAFLITSYINTIPVVYSVDKTNKLIQDLLTILEKWRLE